MQYSILVPLNDSLIARTVVDYLCSSLLWRQNMHYTLLHVLRQPSASEELMGDEFVKQHPARFEEVLKRAKEELVEKGANPKNVHIELVTEPYMTIADGIIDQCKKRKFDMVVIGRRKMSKAEEFVLGDISLKLVRAVEDSAVLVIKNR